MEFWIRAATLQIGSRQYSLDELDFSFEVPFEDSPQLGVATVEVINLSPATRGSIQKFDPIIINAGYRGNIGRIFVGEVVDAVSKRSGTEWKTSITAAEVAKAWITSEINKTYERDMMLKDIVQDLANVAGIEVGENAPVNNAQYPNGLTCTGKTMDVLKNVAQQDGQSRVLIHNGQLFVNDPQKGINQGYLLSKDTGLLRHEEDVEMLPIGTDLNEGQPAEEREGATKTRVSLMNPNLHPSDIVVFQSKSLNGVYQIVRGKHSGSQSGSWTTEIEVKPA